MNYLILGPGQGYNVILSAITLLVFLAARLNPRLAAQQPQSRSLP
jgi:hypothetical protein